jgi:hypothetical protein
MKPWGDHIPGVTIFPYIAAILAERRRHGDTAAA